MAVQASSRTLDGLRIAVGIALVGIILFPIYWMANASLQPRLALLAASPSWFPSKPILDGYINVLATQGGSILTSCFIAGTSALFSLAIAAPCAYALVIFRMRWTTAIIFVVLLVQMIPTVVMANALYTIFARPACSTPTRR